MSPDGVQTKCQISITCDVPFLIKSHTDKKATQNRPIFIFGTSGFIIKRAISVKSQNKILH